ncbi:uncharacterized protein LOC143030425 [Oratosquilla oratoria]|uniref:uncharacterized protein LOC143030425 n=1 Tax=Oratosquilla oratoria TaxID=337810 RepID=UPI003F763C6C
MNFPLYYICMHAVISQAIGLPSTPFEDVSDSTIYNETRDGSANPRKPAIPVEMYKSTSENSTIPEGATSNKSSIPEDGNLMSEETSTSIHQSTVLPEDDVIVTENEPTELNSSVNPEEETTILEQSTVVPDEKTSESPENLTTSTSVEDLTTVPEEDLTTVTEDDANANKLTGASANLALSGILMLVTLFSILVLK